MRSGTKDLIGKFLVYAMLAAMLLAFGYLVVTIWQVRGEVAAISMVGFTLLLIFVRQKAQKKADSIDYSRR